MLGAIMILDLLTLAVCVTLLLRNKQLTYTHPGTVYLIFHVITFTKRGFEIAQGAPTLFSDEVSWTLGWSPVTHDEIIRAMLIGDVALFVMTLGWLKAADDDRRQREKGEVSPRVVRLDGNRMWPIVGVSLLVGIFGLLTFSVLPGRSASAIELGTWGESSWVTNIQTWASIGLIVLIYWYGFKRPLVVPFALYLLIMLYQGFHRFRVIIPALLISQVFVDRRNLKWPPRWMMIAILGVALLFIPMKTIGRMLQQGQPLDRIIEASIQSLTSTGQDAFSELNFLDHFASALTLTDRAGRFYYGTTYLSLLTLPVPRPLWPEKPELNFYLPAISTPDRPMAELGMIVTLHGESYINFGYPGIIGISFLVAYWLARFYFYAYRQGYLSVMHFAYLLTASSLIQVYRDGLTSLILFTMAANAPLVVIIGLHLFFPARKMRQAST